jgi:hypothetical protein
MKDDEGRRTKDEFRSSVESADKERPHLIARATLTTITIVE